MVFAIASLACLAVVNLSGHAADAANKWESAIAQFEKSDKASPPPRGGIVFVGSSSIRLWDLKKSFPDLPAINRGFGGSEAADSAHYADRLVIKHRPRLVVYYAGDNDLSRGKSPETVQADTAEFAKKVRAALPETTIILLSVKPSQARANLVEKQRRTNALFKELAESDPHIKYVDVGSILLDGNGKPRPELFLADRLHLNPEGYRLWAEILKPHLK